MESNERYYARRAVEELRALERAVTPEARARRLALAEAFRLKALQSGRECQAGPDPSSRVRELTA
ncbi:MAG TPA: hypothetical protein VF535_04680 [Allosphingosinicella sp.]|jgi:hypothetical protein